MADDVARAIIRRALELRQRHPGRTALDVLDLAMQGYCGSQPDFSLRDGDGADAHLHQRFGDLLSQAFATAPEATLGGTLLLREQRETDVLRQFAARYGLWRAA